MFAKSKSVDFAQFGLMKPIWVNDLIVRWSQEKPDSVFLFDDHGQKITFQQLEELTRKALVQLRFSSCFQPLLVALALPHGIELVIKILTLLRGEISGLVIDSQTPALKIKDWTTWLPITHLCFDPKQNARFAGIGTPFQGESDSAFYGLEMAVQQGSLSLHPHASWIQLTSGSTGCPKAVQISSASLFERSGSEAEYFELSSSNVSLSSLHYSHDVGFNQILSHLQIGASLLVVPFIFPENILNAIRANGCNGIWGTPYFWRKLLQLNGGSQPLSKKVGLATVSGGSLGLNEQAQLRAALPNSRIVRTYGQSETFRTFFCYQHSESFSQIVPKVSIDWIPSSCGDKTEPLQLKHHGAGQMIGYLGDQPALEDEGITTGDYFTIQTDGSYAFNGRRDDMIKRLDQRFFAVEVENLLRELPEVEDSYVFFKPNNLPEGDLIACLYVAQGKQEANLEDLKTRAHQLCRQKLSLQKTPNRFFVFEQRPSLPNGKLNKSEALRQAKAELERTLGRLV